MPVHECELEHRWKMNVHGHKHEALVMTKLEWNQGAREIVPDKRYLNVSVEQINYTPISLDQILEIQKERGLEPEKDIDNKPTL